MRFLCVSALLIAFSGCDSASFVEVEGTWSLARVERLDGQERPFRPSSITFTDDGDYRSSSCNTCTGTYRARPEAVEIEDPSCTERACAYTDGIDMLNDLSLSGPFDATVTGDTLRLSADVLTPGVFYTFVRAQGE